jgi:hypothetical protein
VLFFYFLSVSARLRWNCSRLVSALRAPPQDGSEFGESSSTAVHVDFFDSSQSHFAAQVGDCEANLDLVKVLLCSASHTSAGSGKEKGNCQDLVYLNIFFLFLLDHIFQRSVGSDFRMSGCANLISSTQLCLRSGML